METTKGTHLTGAMKRKAVEAIEAMAKLQPGIAETQTKLEKQEAGASAHIYGLAQLAADQTKVPHPAMFGELCAYAEGQYKAKHQVTNLKDVLPVWAMFKSNILRGMRLGISPSDHANEYQFRKATREKLAEALTRTTVTTTTVEKPKAETAAPEEVEAFLSQTTIVPRLAVWIGRLTIEAEYVKTGKMKEAEEIFREAVQKLGPLLDQQKIRDDATREALAIAS